MQKHAFLPTQRLECQKLKSIWEKMLFPRLDPALDTIAPLYSEMGRPAKNQSQIIRSLMLFTLLFWKPFASFSLTSCDRDALPEERLLMVMVGCDNACDLPALLPVGKNGKKPKKQISSDGKLVEPEPEAHSTVDYKNKITYGNRRPITWKGFWRTSFTWPPFFLL